jgi:hypothetical protein
MSFDERFRRHLNMVRAFRYSVLNHCERRCGHDEPFVRLEKKRNRRTTLQVFIDSLEKAGPGYLRFWLFRYWTARAFENATASWRVPLARSVSRLTNSDPAAIRSISGRTLRSSPIELCVPGFSNTTLRSPCAGC